MLDNNEVVVIDNFLDVDSFKKIRDVIFSDTFPWNFGEGVAYPSNQRTEDNVDGVCDGVDNFQFAHIIFRCDDQSNGFMSEYYHYLFPIVNKLRDKFNCRTLIRIKINLNPRQENLVTHGFHIDYPWKDSFSAIYYLNTNDGYTLFEDGTKIESVENRMAIFKVNHSHTSSNCTNQTRRVVINFNYL